jgi:hypothetical protein
MDGIQAVCSTNCMSEVAVLKQVHNGMLNRNARMAMHRVSHFAALSCLPNPVTTNPPTMGTEIRIESK